MMFTTSKDAIVWNHVKQSRIQLLAYLETLTNEQWNQESLCVGWKVRDVLAHLILEYHYTARTSWKDFVRSGFRVNEFMKRTALSLGRSSTESLLDQFRLMIDERIKPSSVPTMNVLVDLLVHEQDIRIALGQTKAMNPNSLQLVFSHWEPSEYNFGEKITGLAARLSGLKFVLTDLNMSKGAGKEVIGTAEDILLAAVGRMARINNLQGEGSKVLKSRLK
ncbi:MAG: maleylpyruvate isomerase family mycothiol-dependent enzyme [Candidatus Saccharimonadales bacterium]